MWDYTIWVIPELKNYNSKHLKWKKEGGGKQNYYLCYVVNCAQSHCLY